MPVDYNRIKLLIGRCNGNLKNQYTEQAHVIAVVGDNADYIKDARAALSAATGAEKKTDRYKAAARGVDFASQKTVDYARAASEIRVDGVYGKLEHVARYAKREQGGRVQLRGSKNPLKWVGGRPSADAVESEIGSANETVADAKEYVKQIQDKLHSSGLDTAGSYAGFDALTARLDRAGTKIAKQQTSHEGYLKGKESEREVARLLEGIGADVRLRTLSQEYGKKPAAKRGGKR